MSQPGGKREDRAQILSLEILVIGQYFIERHPGTEEFENHLHRVPQPTNARLAVAYRGVNRDAREKMVHDNENTKTKRPRGVGPAPPLYRLNQGQSDARMRHSLLMITGAGQMLSQQANGTNAAYVSSGANTGRYRAYGYIHMAANESNTALRVR